MWDCPVTHSAAMIRKSVLTDNGIRYEEYFSPAEDYGLWCRLLPVTKFHNIPEVLFEYRDHAENTSLTQAERMLAGGYRVRALNKTLNAQLWNEYELRAVRTWRIRLFGTLGADGVRVRFRVRDANGAVVAADSAVLRQADGKGAVRVPEDLPYGDYSLEAELLDGETAYQDRTEAFRRTGI